MKPSVRAAKFITCDFGGYIGYLLFIKYRVCNVYSPYMKNEYSKTCIEVTSIKQPPVVGSTLSNSFQIKCHTN